MPFSIIEGDIARMQTDAVVNAANTRLAEGGGVCGAIFARAGRWRMARACKKLGTCPTGQAVVTPGFDLPARYVIHAVGPVWHGGTHGEEELLRSAYRSALERALEVDAQSVAFPLISAGIYGYPQEAARAVATDEIRSFLELHDELAVFLVIYDRKGFARSLSGYQELAQRLEALLPDASDEARVADYAAGVSSYYAAATPLESESAPMTWAAPEAPVDAQAAPTQAAPSPSPAPAPAARAPFTAETMMAPQPSAAADQSEATSRHAAPAAKAPQYEKARSGRRAGRWTPENQGQAAQSPAPAPAADAARARYGRPLGQASDLTQRLEHLDASFSATVLSLIDERGLTDVEVYKRANLSRQVFSKLRKDDGYRPTKQTAVALAVALELDLDQTTTLLARAGYALSRANKFDVIVEYCIEQGSYDIFEVNELLFAFDQPLLGSL